MPLIACLLMAGALVAGQDPRPAAVLPPEPTDTDTVLFYDTGVSTTWWCSDRDSFGAVVRFTPPEYPCEVVGARAEVNYDGGQEVYLRAWDDDGPDGKPGTLLYNEQRLDIPPARTPGFLDYDLDSLLIVDSGDFYLGFWQANVWDLQFSSDEAMNHPARQWWFFPDQGWVTPYGMHASDHLIRARVRYGTGVEEELGLAPAGAVGLSPNPANGGRCRVSWNLRGSTPLAITVLDVAGRVRARRAAPAGSDGLELDGLEPGVFVVRVVWPGGSGARRLVVGR
jgi:hypothetical protein